MSKQEFKKAWGFVRTYPMARSGLCDQLLSTAQKVAVVCFANRENGDSKSTTPYLEHKKNELEMLKMFV